MAIFCVFVILNTSYENKEIYSFIFISKILKQVDTAIFLQTLLKQE